MANKAQRKINRWVRRQNKFLAEDAFLGLNRFKMRQVCRFGRETWEYQYVFELIDTKTNETRKVIVDNYNFMRILFWKMNDFIVAIRQKEKW